MAQSSFLTRRALLRAALLGAGGLAASTVAATRAATATTTIFLPVVIAPGAPASGWQQLPGTFPARADHSLTYDPARQRLSLFGGRGANDDLWQLDLAGGTWQRVAVAGPRPAARFGHNACYDPTSRRLIVALGQATTGAFLNDAWAFDPDAVAWTQLHSGSGTAPAPRYGAAAALDDARRLVISHGFTSKGRFDETWRFDLATATWSEVATSGARPLARCLTRGAWDSSGAFLLFGGQANSAPYLGDLWALDVAQGRWAELPASGPSPRNLYGASFDGARRRWYISGGNTASGPAADLWAYDVAAQRWAAISTPNEVAPPRHSHDSALADGKLVLCGGQGAAGALGDSWRLTF